MGISAEQDTVGVLQSVRRVGWRFVTGLKLKDEIDHVAVGPPGVLVLETKWSADPWPIGTNDRSSFLRPKMDDSSVKVHARAKAVAVHEYFRRAIKDASVRPVLVLWSPSPEMAGQPKWLVDERGVTLVQGWCLREWLVTLESNVLDDEAIERIMSELVIRADITDTGPGRPTIDQLFIRVLVEGPVSFLIAANLFLLLLRVLPEWLSPVVGTVLLIAGVRARRWRRLRAVTTGWLVGVGTVGALLIGYLLFNWLT